MVKREDGAVLVVVALSLVALLGITALVVDIGDFRAHRRQLQTAADAGALAGASQLIKGTSGVCGTGGQADYYQRQNDDANSSQNLIKDANLDTSYCTLVYDANNKAVGVRVRPVESNVPYLFGGVLGFASTNVSAKAEARIVYLTTAHGLNPIGVPDLRPQSVTAIIDKTGAQVPLSSGAGCPNPVASSPYPFWCGKGNISGLPAGGSTVSVRVVDVTGVTITFSQVGYIGSDVPLTGCTGVGGTCTIQGVSVTPNTPYPPPYYANCGVSYGATATLKNLPSDTTGVVIDGKTVAGTTTTGKLTVATSTSAFSTSCNSTGPHSISITVNAGSGKTKRTYTATVPSQQVYVHAAATQLQSYFQSQTYVDPSAPAGSAARDVWFDAAFTALTKGQPVSLTLGGGGCVQGNCDLLDLDTTNGCGACWNDPNSSPPGPADELYHGACTPYSIGDLVQTKTGVSAGQIDTGQQSGLVQRIGSSPSAWNPCNPDLTHPPPLSDPRWTEVILVSPVPFGNGNTTVQVVGFGNFYIAQYFQDPPSSCYPNLNHGEVVGIFWDRANPTGAYSLNCTDPANICAESVALVPWDGP